MLLRSGSLNAVAAGTRVTADDAATSAEATWTTAVQCDQDDSGRATTVDASTSRPSAVADATAAGHMISSSWTCLCLLWSEINTM